MCMHGACMQQQVCGFHKIHATSVCRTVHGHTSHKPPLLTRSQVLACTREPNRLHVAMLNTNEHVAMLNITRSHAKTCTLPCKDMRTFKYICTAKFLSRALSKAWSMIYIFADGRSPEPIYILVSMRVFDVGKTGGPPT
jgi:hypothetical protein